jgi:putative oxidoreductase
MQNLILKITNKTKMKKSEPIVRILLGLIIAISGANKFGYWINIAYMEDALDFVVNFSNLGGGPFIYAMGILEILIGIALIANRFKILAILALLPLMVSIVTFHLFLDLKGIAVALIVLFMDLYLLYLNKDRVSSIFSMN